MGGAATNSGIDFQSRVGALAMVSMFAEVHELTALGLHDPSSVERVHFETGDDVDDLMLSTRNSRSFIQAKRTISLSAEADSEFSSVIRQVVAQHMNDPGPDDYILATTSGASSRITDELKKLFESARLNSGHATNPSTKTEADVRDITYSHIDRHFEAHTGRRITDNERTELLAKLHVQVLDLEAGAPLERAVLSVLSARGVPSASAAWAQLTTLALTLAKDRLSIDRLGLLNRLGRVLTFAADSGPGAGAAAAVRSALESHMPTGLEVILFKDEARTVLVTLPRFNENGERYLQFETGLVTLPDGKQREVIRRAASMMGMERMLSAAPDLAGEENLIVEPNDAPGDDVPGAEDHRTVARQLLADNPDIISCLRCGRAVSEDQAPFVEVDEVDETAEVGLVHRRCLRPLHRVLGSISGEGLAHNNMLGDFDYRTWLKGAVGGQGLFNSLGPRLQGKIAPIAWEPGRAHLSAGTWGVVLEHADGNEHFITKRGTVETLSASQAQVGAAFMNESLRIAKEEKNDPWCVSATTQTFGTYSTLLMTAGAEGTPVEVVWALPREMSRAALFGQRRDHNYYAPLLALADLSTNELFAVQETIFVLTDPLRLPEMVANWKAAGIEVPDLGTAILADDDQIDSLVASRALRGEQVVVDPMFGLDGEPISGAWFDPTLLWLADLTDENGNQPDRD